MKERRKGERRSWKSTPKYPFIDSEDAAVNSNRRRTVDRRYNSDTAQTDSNGHSTQSQQLALNWNDRTEVLSDTNPVLLAGRCSPCSFIVNKKFVSRKHAQFEHRDGSFYIADYSTNGTYLRWDNGAEAHLVGNEIPLTGNGVISMGRPITNNVEGLIQFHCTSDVQD
ncbi:MAG: FHA domain-containing protein [Gammaproteobacteria bacterium]|nr:FHA domain-containing protein [Gammaproteobacteria bacterium]